MRILMTVDAVGGVWTYALELAGALAARDVEVVLATLGPPPELEQRRRLRGVAVAGYHERGYALEWMEDGADGVARAGYWLLELADEERADLVHLNGYALAAAPFPAPVLVVAHSCVLSWHEAVRRRPAGPEWDWYRDAVRAGVAAADAVVAPTRAMLREIERLYRPRGLAAVVPNGRSAAGFAPLPKERYILGLGRAWDEAKNLLALDRVAPRLDWPVLVAGAGDALDWRHARPLGAVHGARLEELLGRAAILAAPARYEPFGLAALEAGLAGCALVLGDLESLREVWRDAAAYVDPFDDEELAATLLRLTTDAAGREALAEAARRRALELTPERMADGYLELYLQLARDRATPALRRAG